jgi:three-Cys-motif partner protein
MATENFFTELQKHSDAKLQILNSYVIPWMRKIVLGTQMFGGKCLVIDGFAGQGIYEDNSQGSPIILLNCAIDFYKQALEKKWPPPNIYFIFIEGDSGNYDSLVKNVMETINLDPSKFKKNTFSASEDYPTINVACFNDEFQNVLGKILEEVPSLIPSFCFIDPFGFSQTPFNLIQKYMKNRFAEIFMNFIYEETNRFINHKSEAIQQHISKHFGVTDLSALKLMLGDAGDPITRKQIIVSYYAGQLYNQALAKHVISFEIKKNGRTKLVLFFATKSVIGLSTMKTAMWGVDDTGSYLYDDKKASDQIEFLFFKEEQEQMHIKSLAEQLYSAFSGKSKITKKHIEEFTIISTIYPEGKLITGALKYLESEHKIDVTKISGGKRKPNTYKDVHIDFI